MNDNVNISDIFNTVRENVFFRMELQKYANMIKQEIYSVNNAFYNVLQVQNIQLQEDRLKENCEKKFFQTLEAIIFELYNRNINPSEKETFGNMFSVYLENIKDQVIKICNLELNIRNLSAPVFSFRLGFFLTLTVIGIIIYGVVYSKKLKVYKATLSDYNYQLESLKNNFFNSFGLESN